MRPQDMPDIKGDSGCVLRIVAGADAMHAQRAVDVEQTGVVQLDFVEGQLVGIHLGGQEALVTVQTQAQQFQTEQTAVKKIFDW